MTLGYSIEILSEAIDLGAAHWLDVLLLLAVASVLVVIVTTACAAVIAVVLVAELVTVLLALTRVPAHLQANQEHLVTLSD